MLRLVSPTSAPPKRARGRPRVHTNTVSAAEARKTRDQQRYARVRQCAPAEYIAYEPSCSPDVPAETPPALGLRISPDIPIPQDVTGLLADEEAQYDFEHSERHEQAAETGITSEDEEVTAQVMRIRDEEKDEAVEQTEYEDAITRRMEETETVAAEDAIGVVLDRAIGDVFAPGAERHEGEQVALAVGVDMSMASVSSTSASQLEHVSTQPHAQTPCRSTPSLSHSSQGSRRVAKLPAQSNNLLSWLNRQGTEVPGASSTRRVDRREGTPCSDAIPPRSATPTRSPSPDPQERTAYKLARQLRVFQGCTHEEHAEAERLHSEHHLRPDVNSACSSIEEVTSLLRGDHEGGAPLPNVLGDPHMMKRVDLPTGLDLKGAFEGVSPADMGTADESLPRNLCLSQHSSRSNKNRVAGTTFDIDSLCCFPSSLGFARQGIHWFPRCHTFLNLSADIHFALPVPTVNRRGELSTRSVPLHKIPHYCFGSAVGMDSLFIFVFFPELHQESLHEHSTYLSLEDQDLWYDAVLLPALLETVGDSNPMQHYPVSAHVAGLDARALAAENMARKESAREQLLKYVLQPQHLDVLWTHIRERVAENPGYSRFGGATLFAHSKNTKLEHMDASLTSAYGRWEQAWSRVADPQFYSRERTYVDLGKQVTSEDSALPYDSLPAEHEAEVYLWKRCCLEAYARTRIKTLANGTKARGSPGVRTYPWATTRESMGQTLFAPPHSQESADGLIYTQHYALIKTPFDTSKTYVFQNDALENLALDPGYIRSLQQQGGGATFSQRVCEFAYLHSKKRAHANLTDNRWRSYGVREEHRVSLAMMDAVCEQWKQWDLYDDSIDEARGPTPYYVVPTKALLAFLSAQINKYCFLFEHVLAHTARTYSLPETMVMVVALRALRFCYGSSMIGRESLLYKDRWEHTRAGRVIVKEGMGMKATIERCGIGWFLPKFRWHTVRLAPPHGENLLVGNVLMHAEYKRRWRAVKDLRDVFVRFNQAEGWYKQYDMPQHPMRLRKWLEYLHVLSMQQFDADVWRAMLAAHKGSPELSPTALAMDGSISYCYRGMKKLFLVDGAVSPPHLVTGNKMHLERSSDVLTYLFMWGDQRVRQGWANKPYRLVLQKSFELIARRLGRSKADCWLHEFLHLVRLTHWILPYPSGTSFISSTKKSRSQGLTRRMMWFSAVFVHPTLAPPLREGNRNTLGHLLQVGHSQRQTPRAMPTAWNTTSLIYTFRKAGVRVLHIDEQMDYWVVGRRSEGAKGFLPVWETEAAPRLRLLGKIKDKSLDELDELMVGFARVPEEPSEAGEHGARARPERRDVRAFFSGSVGTSEGRRTASTGRAGAAGGGDASRPQRSRRMQDFFTGSREASESGRGASVEGSRVASSGSLFQASSARSNET